MGRPGTDTKQKLIDTALELMWVSSYGSVSVDDICKKADVKKGSFYHYFPSKVELTIAAMEERYKNLETQFNEVFSAAKDPVTRFERLAELIYEDQIAAFQKYGRICGCPCTAISSELAGQEESVRRKFDDFMNAHERYYENALRDLVAQGYLPPETDVEAKAHDVFTYLLGQVMMARIGNDIEGLRRDLKAGVMRTLGITSPAKKEAVTA